MTQQFTQDIEISYSDMEAEGFSLAFINDYQGFKQAIRPITGTEADPNNVFTANLSGYYVKTNAPTALWFNASPGSRTGWIQLV